MSGTKTPSPNKKVSKEDPSTSRSPSSKNFRSKNDAIVKKEENYLARCTNYRLTSGYEVTICNCKHIRKIRIGERHSICNPQRWLCNTCLTTESVWACLSCPNVACGRFIKEHALTHFQESGHPLAIDVNELYVFCYKCDDYVLNDNNSSDIKVLRETLLAIRYQNFTGTTRSGHTLRSAMITEQEDLEMRRKMQQDQLDRDDRLFTAIWHSRFVRQRKSFRQWLRYVKWKKTRDDSSRESDVSDSEATASDEEEKTDNTQDSCTQPLPNNEQTPENTPAIELFDKKGLPPSPKCPPLPISLTLEIITNSESVVPNFVTETSDLAKSDTDDHKVVKNDPEPPIDSSITNPLKKIPETAVSDTKEINANNEDIISTKETPVVGDGAGVTENSKSVKPDNVGNDRKVVDKYIPPVSLNILSRPKRTNAAARYKEIFSSLGVGPLKKVSPCPIPSHGLLDEPPVKKRRKSAVPNLPGRRSDRIRKIERVKELAAKRKQSRSKKGFQWSGRKRVKREAKFSDKKKTDSSTSSRTVIKKQKAKSSIYQPSRARRLISGASKISKKSDSYQPPSLYDNVPNKAVTSLIPGVTGLRNLGNTCYLNSIIQVLGHLQKFRLCLLGLREMELRDYNNSKAKDGSFCFATPQSKVVRALTRRSTVELYNEQVKPTSFTTRNLERKKSGLNGGQSPQQVIEKSLAISTLRSNCLSPTLSAKDYWSSSLSLCNELDHLYQVMWSGKWKLVSPYHFLHSVWSLIPSFRGYTQQDAQEFLCELLDKIVSELRRNYTDSSTENKIAKRMLKVVETVFEGSLKSEVRCLECGNVSSTVEPFWDLSLEFPERYHKINAKRKSTSGNRPATVPCDPCTLQEMLENFTAPETLDGGKVYGCSKCNFLHQSKGNPGCSQKKNVLYRKYSQLLTEAEKQLKVLELPQILRFHLKRFRWIGRNHREKISVHVDFPSELDMRKYCWDLGKNEKYMYDLSAVVMHHGRGFGSGHYTANCWNGIGEFWVHCNDSNLELCSIEDVMASQAYILFYTLRGIDPQPHIFSPPLTPTVPSPNSLSPVASETGSAEISASDFEGTDSISL